MKILKAEMMEIYMSFFILSIFMLYYIKRDIIWTIWKSQVLKPTKNLIANMRYKHMPRHFHLLVLELVYNG